jgi:hypothetical protein
LRTLKIFFFTAGFGDAWLGTNNNADRESNSYASRVLNSKVALSIRSIGNSLNENKINEIRNLLKISCNNQEEVACDLTQSRCLFKIDEDPCEKKNLAGDPRYADILQDMLNRLDTAMIKVVEPRWVPGGKCMYILLKILLIKILCFLIRFQKRPSTSWWGLDLVAT